MASSPVTSEDLPLLSEQTDLCTRMSALIRVYDLFREFLDWLLDSSGNISDDALESFADRMQPVGTVIMLATHVAPSDKWLFCNGQAVSRTTYATLFGRLQTVFGVGDGSTTFNLPDMRDRFPVGYGTAYAMGAGGGEATVTLGLTNMPSHFHGMGLTSTSSSSDVQLTMRTWSNGTGGTTNSWGVTGDDPFGTSSTLTSGDVATTTEITDGSTTPTAHNNLPPYRSLAFFIKAL